MRTISPAWAARAVVVVAALGTFARGIPRPLMESWDDRRFLIEFEPVQRVSWDSLVRIFSEVHFQAWHPLHLLSYWIDVPWVGPSGPVIHAVNAVLWALALLLALRVLERLGLPLWAAALGTLAFGLHPVQVEAVTWATGRKEIVALALACSAILAHLRSEGPWDRAAWVSRVLYVLAAMAKTTVLPLPVVLFLIDVLLRDVRWRAAALRQAPAAAIGVAFAGLVVSIWSAHEMIRPGEGGDEGTGSASLVAATYTHYLRTALFPAENAPVYPIYRHGEVPLSGWLGPLALAVAFAIARRARAPRAQLAIAGFAVMLLPVSNLIPVYFQFQDRYLSLPLLPLGFGFGAAAAWVGAKIQNPKWAGAAIGAVLVAALAARTVQYQEAWSGDLRLWQHAAATHPTSFYAWMKVGEILRDQGRLEASAGAYARAVDVAPELRLGHAAVFNVAALRDERDEDISPSRALAYAERYHAALDDANALRELAGEMASRGYRDAVILALGRSLDLAPVDDDRLEQAAARRLASGELWLARFYLSRMTRDPILPALRELDATLTPP